MSSQEDGEESTGFSHHDLTIEQVDPNELVIDEVNERDSNIGPRNRIEGHMGDLEKSIAEIGILNPPQARPGEDGRLKVYAGQRRVQAAQAVGLEKIPVIVKNLNDAEARAASINENNEYLKKEVPRKDRAKAIRELEKDWSRDEVADYFGVKSQTIRNWLEPTREFWSDTIFDPEVETDLDTEYIADDLLAQIRRVTDDKSLAETIAEQIIDKGIPKQVVRSAAETTDDPRNFWDEIKEQWFAVGTGQELIRPRITLTGDAVDEVRKRAKDRGINEQTAVKQLVLERIEQLSEDNEDNSVAISLEEELLTTIKERADDTGFSEEEIILKIIEQWYHHVVDLGIDMHDITN